MMINSKFAYSSLLLVALILFGAGVMTAGSEENKIKISDSAPNTEKASDIKWLKYDEGLALAKKEGKNIFVNFTAKWCGYCKRMNVTTFKDPRILDMFDKHFITVIVDGDSHDSLNIDGWLTTERQPTREYKVTGYPTYWFLNPKGEKLVPMKGYQGANRLYDALDYLKDDTYKTTSFKDFLEKRDASKDKDQKDAG